MSANPPSSTGSPTPATPWSPTIPGLTRDRQYGVGRIGPRPYIVVDTGGISNEVGGVEALMQRQVQLAIEEADHILFLVDAKDGCTTGDYEIGERLRRLGKPMTLVVNKADHAEQHLVAAEFHALGLGDPLPFSATQGRGVRGLMDQVLEALDEAPVALSDGDLEPGAEDAEPARNPQARTKAPRSPSSAVPMPASRH